MPVRPSAVRNAADNAIDVSWQPPASFDGTIVGRKVALDTFMPDEKSFAVLAALDTAA